MLDFKSAQTNAVDRAMLVGAFANMSEFERQRELEEANLMQLVNTGGQIMGDILGQINIMFYLILGVTLDDVQLFLNVSGQYINDLGYTSDKEITWLATQAALEYPQNPSRN